MDSIIKSWLESDYELIPFGSVNWRAKSGEMPANVNKAQALEKLLKYLKYNRKMLIACGDGLNDISMIEYAGIGVAMGNAQDIVKEKADFITKSNAEDGVANAIDIF